LKAYKQYDGFYHVDHTRFSDIDQAVDFFITEAFTSKNVGYIQSRLMNKNLLGEYDLEKPTSKIKNLFQEEGNVYKIMTCALSDIRDEKINKIIL
jgi:CMP-N-acetylneuraminic acid synthetase